MKALADYVHAKGLKLGIYSDAGCKTCALRFGSLGHEYQDALQYARWGIDYLKYDWCNSENINPVGAYTLMRDALRAAGRPILFSICEWGTNKPWEWAQEVGHLWRTTQDIGLAFSDPADFKVDWRPRTVLETSIPTPDCAVMPARAAGTIPTCSKWATGCRSTRTGRISRCGA